MVSFVKSFEMLCLSQPVDGPVEKDSGVLLSAQTITSETISTTTTTQITKVCSVFMFTMKVKGQANRNRPDSRCRLAAMLGSC